MSNSLAFRGLLLSVLAGVIGVSASWAAADSKVIAHAGLIKGHLIATAQVTAKAPKALSFTITSKPAQKVKVDWSVVCAKPLGKPVINAEGQAVTSLPQEKEGIFSATTPITRPLPITVKHPAACIVNVYGTLSKHGTELIRILQD